MSEIQTYKNWKAVTEADFVSPFYQDLVCLYFYITSNVS